LNIELDLEIQDQVNLNPQDKEEQEELSGVAAILPSKWSYCACIVPFSDVEL